MPFGQNVSWKIDDFAKLALMEHALNYFGNAQENIFVTWEERLSLGWNIHNHCVVAIGAKLETRNQSNVLKVILGQDIYFVYPTLNGPRLQNLGIIVDDRISMEDIKHQGEYIWQTLKIIPTWKKKKKIKNMLTKVLVVHELLTIYFFWS